MIAYYKGKAIAGEVVVAKTFFQRFMGLMGQKDFKAGQGMLIKNCSAIHCFFMRFPIDVVYLSEDMKILHCETVKPWRVGSFVKSAKHVLELPEGEGVNLQLGGQIVLEQETPMINYS